MSESKEDHLQPVEEPWLDYKCTLWTISSQRAADLYSSGVKLWRKEDLVDIEQQLVETCNAQKFTLRRLDGSVVHIKNPMFGVLKPIWEPVVRFQEYWHLVQSTPDGPPETYHCTYLVDWVNRTVRNYESPLMTSRQDFASSRDRWNASMTCQAFTTQLRELLLRADGTVKKVTKIVCFGLGDLNVKPKDWWRIRNDELPPDTLKLESSINEAALIHHAMALTIADIVRSCSDHEVRILSQDPSYIEQLKTSFEISASRWWAPVAPEGLPMSAMSPLSCQPLPKHRSSKSLQILHAQWRLCTLEIQLRVSLVTFSV